MEKKRLLSFLIVLGIMFIMSAIILTLMSAVIWKSQASGAVVSAVVTITYIVACFTGGILAGKITGKHKFLYGIIIGAVYFGIVLLAGVWIFKANVDEYTGIAGKWLICIVAAMFGGMLAPSPKN